MGRKKTRVKIKTMKKILVVDDDGFLNNSLCDILLKKGYDALSARDGAEAVRMLEKRAPAVALIDIALPIKSGLEVIVDGRKVSPLTEYIIITGHSSQESAIKAMNAGAFNYFLKPYDKDQLLLTIEKAIERWEKNAQYKEIEEIAGIGVWTRTVGGSLEWSDQQYRLFGYEPGELKPSFELVGSHIHPDDLDMFIEANDTAVAEQAPYELFYRIITKNGNTRQVQSRARVEKDESTGIIYMRGTLQDITERKKMLDEIAEKQKLEAIGTLAGAWAHDFNNLLGGIMGYVDLARINQSFDDLDKIETIVEKAKELTGQFITFSRGGAPKKQPEDLPDILDGIFRPTNDLKVEFDIEDGLQNVSVDRTQIELVLRNIYMNSVEAITGKGTISVTARNSPGGINDTLPEGNYIELIIKDSGVGIPYKNLQKVFNPSYSTKEMGTRKGMGMGLAIAYSIVKRHYGHIKIYSGGVGTTVSLYLPADDLETTVEETLEVVDRKRTGRVLIMDDEEMILKVNKQILSRFGYEPEGSKDGKEAIEIYKKAKDEGNPFDVVILDLTIKKGMGGKDTIKAIREFDPQVKAIVISGYSNDPVMTDFKKYGFRDALPKPYTGKDLRKAIEKLYQ